MGKIPRGPSAIREVLNMKPGVAFKGKCVGAVQKGSPRFKAGRAVRIEMLAGEGGAKTLMIRSVRRKPAGRKPIRVEVGPHNVMLGSKGRPLIITHRGLFVLR